MKIAVLGTGRVGGRLASKLVEFGHAVTLGSRTADNATATEWAGETGGAHGTFAAAAAGSMHADDHAAGTSRAEGDWIETEVNSMDKNGCHCGGHLRLGDHDLGCRWRGCRRYRPDHRIQHSAGRPCRSGRIEDRLR
ncbi:NAD(P)-binding domain-containing protein [Nocardia sp. NPDC049707]|uniref:NAD(P)-binding domain-containing protein n=1 Tax=Nocardia sp. NPDC049707 TaxID=3154735 RepID=UPI003425D7D6